MCILCLIAINEITFRQLYSNLLLISEPAHQITFDSNFKHQIARTFYLLSSKGASDARQHCGKTVFFY